MLRISVHVCHKRYLVVFLPAEFLTRASRLAVRSTGVLCHQLCTDHTNWDKRSCDEQTHEKVRNGLGCHREGYSHS